MYGAQERHMYFQQIVTIIEKIPSIEGIIQIGSGVQGYTDAYSDIDLMIATNTDVDKSKQQIKTALTEMGANYIKEGQFSATIFLLIPFFPNGLEMNISVLPIANLSVKSPLWRIQFDRHGDVHKMMEEQAVVFQQNGYVKPYNISFEFAYTLRKLRIELKRRNVIYAMQMLEQLREHVLTVQAINEHKKLHQLKAFHTLNETFINSFLASYPTTIDASNIEYAACKITDLFKEVVQKSYPGRYNISNC